MILENSDTYGYLRLLLLVLAAALVFGAVCVGGVSADTYYVGSQNPGNLESGEHYYSSLSGAVSAANNNAGDDKIVILENIAIDSPDPIIVSNGKITIVNAEGVDVTITKNAPSRDTFSVIYYYSSFFDVNNGGTLILDAVSPGSLTLDGEQHILDENGGAVYVNGGSFEMNEGVTITRFGYVGNMVIDVGFFKIPLSNYDGSGIYVEDGDFVMNGGNIT